MLGRTRRIHFVGVGGIGMSGIAELLANQGYVVSGSDAKASDVTRRLATLGVRVFEGHAASHVGEADVVVVSSAVRPSNPEVVEARVRKIPVIPRAEMLAELMRLRYGIAIAGAHGKTTTTSMTALVLERGGLDPTAVIGGRLSAFGSNARLGRGEYMVAEADESDGSFLKLSPTIAVITNVDEEHLDHYQTLENVLTAFVDFANKVPFYGAVVACVDDPRLLAVLPRITRRVVTYGLDTSKDGAHFADGAEAIVVGCGGMLEAFGSRCRVLRRAGGRADGPHETLGELQLRVPGRHNLLNALAAVAVGLELGLSFERVASALGEFKGAERRFDVLGEADGVMAVDDYGHHPTEIAAVLAAARAGMDRRLVVAFQPHRYTRTQKLLREFAEVLSTVDDLVLTDIYGAGEDPIPGVTIDALAEEIGRVSLAASRLTNVDVVHSVGDLPAALARLVRPGDMVITLGAGSIGTVGARLLEMLRVREAGGGGAEGGAEGGAAGGAERAPSRGTEQGPEKGRVH